MVSDKLVQEHQLQCHVLRINSLSIEHTKIQYENWGKQSSAMKGKKNKLPLKLHEFRKHILCIEPLCGKKTHFNNKREFDPCQTHCKYSDNLWKIWWKFNAISILRYRNKKNLRDFSPFLWAEICFQLFYEQEK